MSRLTQRELEVLRHVAQGANNDEIAAALFISPRTASVHVSRILGKLEVSSRSKAAAIAYQEGLAGHDPPELVRQPSWTRRRGRFLENPGQPNREARSLTDTTSSDATTGECADEHS